MGLPLMFLFEWQHGWRSCAVCHKKLSREEAHVVGDEVFCAEHCRHDRCGER